MCQAISITAASSELTERFELDNVLFHTSGRYEIQPTESISAIIHRKDERVLDEFRWGMVPYWAKDSVQMDSMKLFEKPIYERIANKQRCIIPCNGFYVSRTEGKEEKKFKITMRSGTFAVAGLYDVFRAASGEEMRTCTMLMTKANGLIAQYQPQMPAILEQEDISDWLTRGARTPFELKNMLRMMESVRMIAIPVTPSGEADVEFESPRTEYV
ncbi:SOS response-associated peptidase [Paenibacillus sacheonensis]|uniref:Abasic site processing protein n=1 Tax=Paenibacillus sacheonensis TaxID=742054 RepID=A0A7X4YUC4_9BACL|nr:SOS response-associated peptidase [Paenibacillus sacheonensis]MBM7568925.1 putative SOS response-associated peptidase YedK [Paenibacillus sacheonensis]NBC72700.1 SOS response-associated peptidase [Paenibacillus sacheonensis]